MHFSVEQGIAGQEECNYALSILAIDPHSHLTAQTTWKKGFQKNRQTHSSSNRLAFIINMMESRQAIATYESALKSKSAKCESDDDPRSLYAPKDFQKAYDLAKDAYKLAPDAPNVRILWAFGLSKWKL